MINMILINAIQSPAFLPLGKLCGISFVSKELNDENDENDEDVNGSLLV